MPSALSFLSSFERSLKGLDPQQKLIVARILEAFIVYLETNGDLLEAKKISPRFFFKKLRTPYYEAGVETRLRIIFEKHAGNFYAILTGDHDQIKRFLSQA